jgi:CheY-like chemotaxis protein
MTKILVIDDSPVIRRLLSDFLIDNGFDVEAPEDLELAVSMAIQGEFDICFCDVHMPQRSGYDIFREVSKHAPNLKFVLTDSMPDHLAEQARREGTFVYLRKPFDLNQVREVLQKLLPSIQTP